MCVTAIANLQQQAQKKGKIKHLFDKDQEIIPYMEQYWESMTTMPRRVTQSWQVLSLTVLELIELKAIKNRKNKQIRLDWNATIITFF